ncbi:hibernation-associated plasma protein HP-27-like [Littorina saxatilis]|uniref:C1q domain-containing protein n=1 Tax=Littorina saxatilis TaxID=31220 RepID=A0AAN9B1H4_9CAEN
MKLLLLLLSLTVMASAKPSAGNDHSRVRRTDDVSLSTLQNLLDRQASFIQTLQSELTAMKNDLSATKNTQVATVSKLNAAESRLHFLESHQSAALGFTVQLANDPVDIGPKGTLKFDHFVTSLGGGYDAHTGIFTAPVSGLYVFYLTIMSSNGHYIEVTLVKEGVSLDTAHAGATDSHNFYDQGSLLVTVHLNKGEQVWNERAGGDSTIVRGSFWTVFSGYLIHAG